MLYILIFPTNGQISTDSLVALSKYTTYPLGSYLYPTIFFSILVQVVADTAVVDVNSAVQGRIQNILTERGFRYMSATTSLLGTQGSK